MSIIVSICIILIFIRIQIDIKVNIYGLLIDPVLILHRVNIIMTSDVSN